MLADFEKSETPKKLYANKKIKAKLFES